jgi:hypothetical protein
MAKRLQSTLRHIQSVTAADWEMVPLGHENGWLFRSVLAQR